MRKAILLAVAAVLATMVCAPWARAEGESIVPPGNSAASQYTEAFPTPKGEKESRGQKTNVTPAKVLGHRTARHLEQQGPEGQAVADFAAETSPAEVEPAAEVAMGGHKNQSQGPDSGADHAAGGEEKSEGSGAAVPTSSGGSGGGGEPSGSSAAGEVVSQATGVSSGTLGLLLPLFLVAVVIWAAFFVRRSRQQRVV